MKRHSRYIAAAFLIAGTLSAQTFNRDLMPKPGPTPTIQITQPKSFQLKNGLTVMVVENHKLPRVTVSLSIDRPPVYEGDIAGVNSIMAEQLGNGTASMTKDDFNRRVDYLGASLRFSPTGGSANTLSKYFPEVFKLMADAVVHPQFSPAEIEKSKERTVEGLKADEKNASSIADRVFTALTYGKNTARGEFETIESVQKIQPSDVTTAYSKYYAPNNAYLVVVGDVKYNDVKRLAEQYFAPWKKTNTTYETPRAAANVSATEINVVDVPTAVQSVVTVGNVTDMKMNNPQYFPALLGNQILGGGSLESRLNMNLREKNGFTYGAYSSMDTGKYSPDFSAQANVRNEVAAKAVAEFMNELNGISTIKPEELANAKAKLKGNFIMSMERPETIARFAVTQKVQNLPDDFYANYLKSIDNVTVPQVQTAVAKVVMPKNTRIFVAGKGSEIGPELEKLGYPVKYYDAYAKPVEKPVVKTVDASVTPASVAANYFNAIGGRANAEKVNSLTTTATTTVQGMPLEMKMIQAKGGKMMMDISMMGNSVQKVVFDGKDGYMMAQGKKMPMPAETKVEMARNTQVFPELDFGKTADIQVTGIEKMNNEDVYAVKAPGVIYYYSVKTGLKTGEVKTQKMGETTMTVPTNYSNYKEVSGVKLPYTIAQNMMGQDITFDVKSYEVNQAKDSDFK